MRTIVDKQHSAIRLELPELSPDQIDRIGNDIKYAVSVILYNNNVLTLKSAHEMIGVSRYEFEADILPKFGATVLGNEDIEAELNLIDRKFSPPSCKES